MIDKRVCSINVFAADEFTHNYGGATNLMQQTGARQEMMQARVVFRLGLWAGQNRPVSRARGINRGTMQQKFVV